MKSPIAAMPDLYFTPATIRYIQLLLALLVSIFLGALLFERERKPPRQNGLLLLAFACITLFSFLVFLEASSLPAKKLPSIHLENTVLGILLAVLIQFAYHFPNPLEKQKTERRIVLFITGAYALAEAGIAAWRFRPGLMDVFVALEFLWVVFVFARSSFENWRRPEWSSRAGREPGEAASPLASRVEAQNLDLLAANQRLRQLTIAIEQSPSAIIITDTRGSIEYVNPAFTQATGYTFEEVKGKNPRILKSDLTPAETFAELWETVSAGQTWRGELINKKKNGEIFWEHTVMAPIFDEAGKTTHYVAVKEDITERILVERALRESEKQYRALFDLESDALFIIRNSDGQILEANAAASQLYGFTREELLTKHNTDLSAEPEATQKATNSPLPQDLIVKIPLRWHRKKDGTRFPVGITARFAAWKGESVHIAAIRDITEQYQVEQELVRLAVTDALTGLPNRRHFLSQAGQVFARSTQPPYSLSLLMLDLDHFKTVNDRFGHSAGDQVLCDTARVLNENLRANDLLARMGGEEFSILLPRTPAAEARQIAARLCQAVAANSVQMEDRAVSVTVSIGLAVMDDSTRTLDELMSRADKALYRAKESGRNCFVPWDGDK